MSNEVRLLTEPQVRERIPYGRTSLWRMIRAGKFPPGVLLSPRRRVWRSDTIDRWIEIHAPAEEISDDG